MLRIPPAFAHLGPLVAWLVVSASCRPTSHTTAPSDLGTPSSLAVLAANLDDPGPVTVETVVGADWSVPRSGLIDLHHPRAVAEGLEDGPEPIYVGFHALRHPTHGLFIVDTGVERALRDDPSEAAPRGWVAHAMHVDRMKIHTDTATWLDRQSQPLAGVFLTHLHLDHVTGMRDVPAETPVYVGPGEATSRRALHAFTRRSTNAALEGKGPLRVWDFDDSSQGGFEGVLDVFGDHTVWALWVPGHTAGSVAFVIRTPDGPVLLTGDACHTTWGWEHEVEPGTFSEDRPRSAISLHELRVLADAHPTLDVRPGHQLNTPVGPSS